MGGWEGWVRGEGGSGALWGGGTRVAGAAALVLPRRADVPALPCLARPGLLSAGT